MLGLSLWEGRLPGQKTIENEDKAAMGSYRPESNFGTSDTVSSPRGPLSLVADKYRRRVTSERRHSARPTWSFIVRQQTSLQLAAASSTLKLHR